MKKAMLSVCIVLLLVSSGEAETRIQTAMRLWRALTGAISKSGPVVAPPIILGAACWTFLQMTVPNSGDDDTYKSEFALAGLRCSQERSRASSSRDAPEPAPPPPDED